MEQKDPLIGVIRGYDAAVAALAFVSNATLCRYVRRAYLANWQCIYVLVTVVMRKAI